MKPDMIHRRRLIDTLFVAAIGAAGLAAGPSFAQEGYASKPIKLIVGFPPGGPTDIVARLLAERLREALGQPVLVENRAGAGGNLAAELVARSPADGYTLLYASSSIAISPGLYDKLGFDLKRDFAPVAETVSIPLVLLVNPKLPVSNLPEFVRYAKANPGKLNYASSGNGTITHLAAALFSLRNGIQTQHIPYKGTAPALTDLVAGNVEFTIGTINTALPFVREGRLRAIAVTGLMRAPSLPNVPTLDESGMKGFEASAWQGVLAPAGTPPAIVERLSTEITKALGRPDLRAQLAPQDAEVRATPSARFGEYLNAEASRWLQVIKETGAKPE